MGNEYVNAGTATGVTVYTTTGTSFYGFSSSTGEGGAFTSVDNYGCEGQSINSLGGYFHSQNSEGLDCSSIFNYALHVAGRTKLDTVLSGGNSMLTWDSITQSVHRQPLPTAGTNYWIEDLSSGHHYLYPNNYSTDSVAIGGNTPTTIFDVTRTIKATSNTDAAIKGLSLNTAGVYGYAGGYGQGVQGNSVSGFGVYGTLLMRKGKWYKSI